MAETFRNRRVLSKLFGEVTRLAKSEGEIRGLKLYVMESNKLAKRAYKALGMGRASYNVYETLF